MNDWFAEKLLSWYKSNKRDLPWRNEKDPYKIWISEIILQQTQVKQGLSYYHRFLVRYPSVQKLAIATENDVMKMWEGLGYYSRARNLHATAKIITHEHNGKFPESYQKIIELKGIGVYTASAIASFAYNLPHAVVDGNVYRVLSRVFGIETPIDSTAGKKAFQELANSLLPAKNASQYNQAIMEFGSQYCKTKSPNCGSCIFSGHCLAYSKSWVNRLPLKEKKTRIKSRYLNYLVFINSKKEVSIRKRTEKDIWQGLYEFPKIESEKPMLQDMVIKETEKSFQLKALKKALVFSSDEYKHLLTHITIYATFHVLQLSSGQKTSFKKVPLNQLRKFAFPQLIVKFMKDCRLAEIV